VAPWFAAPKGKKKRVLGNDKASPEGTRPTYLRTGSIDANKLVVETSTLDLKSNTLNQNPGPLYLI